MATITLAKALKLRKRVRTSLDSFRSTGLVYRKEKDNEPTYRGFDNFEDYFKSYLKTSDILVQLNTKIDEANVQRMMVTAIPDQLVSIRSLLNNIENLKHLTPHYSNILSQRENFDKKSVAKEFDSYLYNPDTKTLGAYETIQYECVVKDSAESIRKSLNDTIKAIRKAEDGISELNSIIKIELTDEDLEFIETL